MDEMNEIERFNEEHNYRASVLIGFRKDGKYDVHSTLIKKDTLKEIIKATAAIAEGVLKDE